jgi:GR25 family glycosyltransferase involved in LPS biosynthesis
MNLNSIKLDAIYIINLESDVERKKKIEETIRIYGLYNLTSRVIYFKAFDYRYRQLENNYKFLGPVPAYGCTLSHLGCIKDAQNNNYTNILIFEDDIIINKKFDELWNNIIIPDDWNIIHLGAIQINWTNIVLNGNYYKSHKTLGGFSYIVKKEMFPIIQEYYEIHRRPIDEICLLIQNDYPCYTIYPNLFINYVNKSYIRQRNNWTVENKSALFKWNLDEYKLK